MAGGMIWLSRITEHSSYASGLLGPMMLTALTKQLRGRDVSPDRIRTDAWE